MVLCDKGAHELGNREIRKGFCERCLYPEYFDDEEAATTTPTIKKRPPKLTWAPKKKRRKAIHLSCGCSYYGGIDCEDGFTHRGITHVHTVPDWLLLRRHQEPNLLPPPEHNNNGDGEQNNNITNQSQPQPAESVGSPDLLAELGGTFSITSSEWRSIIR
ncbi:putative transcription activation protein [Tomato pseudo-curly top virus]|uniref:Protein C2 n=1 Tax=Tomato pseudo-curly top virus TaxID=49267 RepID=C2_TPCTV|nr:putative transcription activation protein [Tomato pseudo-curly top virus]Q88889.1 RecName: Full=Protein C2; AltName: Full=Protein L2 [Tomato pseudo-curly top virus]CAA59224.1 ORF C2 [Tomato pseudo-curly top virus]